MQIKNSDILKETTGIIVHGCNAQGKFGAGLAGQIRRKYPQVFEDYLKAYGSPLFGLGMIIPTKVDNDLYIVSAITQKYYGRDKQFVYVNYKAIEQAFIKVNELAVHLNQPVKFPLIGCGLANGDWKVVNNIIDKCLDPFVERILFKLDSDFSK